jgi:hypothetical protein
VPRLGGELSALRPIAVRGVLRDARHLPKEGVVSLGHAVDDAEQYAVELYLPDRLGWLHPCRQRLGRDNCSPNFSSSSPSAVRPRPQPFAVPRITARKRSLAASSASFGAFGFLVPAAVSSMLSTIPPSSVFELFLDLAE